MTRSSCPLFAAGLGLLLLSTSVHAQQVPVTGRMLSGPLPAASAPAPSTAPRQIAAAEAAEIYALDDAAAPYAAAPAAAASAPPPPAPRPVPPPAPVSATPTYAAAPAPAPPVRLKAGDATRQLLQLQASGAQAGRALPILGDQATASYQRYLKSFDHDLPVFFENNVGKSIQGGGGN